MVQEVVLLLSYYCRASPPLLLLILSFTPQSCFVSRASQTVCAAYTDKDKPAKNVRDGCTKTIKKDDLVIRSWALKEDNPQGLHAHCAKRWHATFVRRTFANVAGFENSDYTCNMGCVLSVPSFAHVAGFYMLLRHRFRLIRSIVVMVQAFSHT